VYCVTTKTSISDLIHAIQDANGPGDDTPISIEDETGRRYEYVDVYMFEGRYVLAIQSVED
jgi:hypothetical protein